MSGTQRTSYRFLLTSKNINICGNHFADKSKKTPKEGDEDKVREGEKEQIVTGSSISNKPKCTHIQSQHTQPRTQRRQCNMIMHLRTSKYLPTLDQATKVTMTAHMVVENDNKDKQTCISKKPNSFTLSGSVGATATYFLSTSKNFH